MNSNLRRVNPLAGLVVGAVFVLVGLLGFTASGDHPAAGPDGGHLLGLFQVNIAHNVVHLAVGAALIVGAFVGLRISRAVNVTVGAVYLVVGLAGLFLMDSAANIIALNAADNVLHLAIGAALVTIGVVADRAPAAGPVADAPQ